MLHQILLALALIALFAWLYRVCMKELDEGRSGPQYGLKWTSEKRNKKDAQDEKDTKDGQERPTQDE